MNNDTGAVNRSVILPHHPPRHPTSPSCVIMNVDANKKKKKEQCKRRERKVLKG
jgi:hypothetical protein